MLKILTVAACLILAPFGVFSLAIFLNLGVYQSIDRYGEPFTLIAALCSAALVVVLGFLLDRREYRYQSQKED